MSLIEKWTKSVLKSVSNSCIVATHKIISALVEAGRTISYVETVSNKADTLHRHLKNVNKLDLKKSFELNTRKALYRMGLGKVVLAVDTTQELYYGKNGKLNVRQIERGKGTDEHVHLTVDCSRTISDAMLMQIIKGFSSCLLFMLCPNFRKRYPRGEFWNDGYFCAGCGSDFERALRYIENQEIHHSYF